MEVLKSRVTRLLREQELFEPEQPIWATHGSTRYLRTEESLNAACHYVIEEQGDYNDEIAGQLPTRTIERRFPA